jgi:hypothetical protein
METNTKFYLAVIGVIILIAAILGAIIVGSQYMLDESNNANHPCECNETTNDTTIYCYNVNHPYNNSEESGMIYPGFVFVV